MIQPVVHEICYLFMVQPVGPCFVIRRPPVEIYKSEVFDRVKKGDPCLFMVVSPLMVCSDILVEFFNKSKRTATKVRFAPLYVFTT